MRGLLIEKGEGWYIVLTPTGQYKKIKGTITEKIGAEVRLPNTTVAPVYVRAAALAAAFLLFFALAASQHLLLNNRVFAYITIEANHDAEFAVDRQNRVLSAKGYGPEAVEILSRIGYLGADVDKVISEFTLASLEGADTGAEEKEIVVSYYPLYKLQAKEVDSKLEQLAKEQQKIIGEKGKQVQFATVVVDKETREEANSKGVAPGRLKKAEASEKTKDENTNAGEAGDSKAGGKKQNADSKGKGSGKDKGEDTRETETQGKEKDKDKADKEKEKQDKKQAKEKEKQDKEDEKNEKKQDKEVEKAEKKSQKDDSKEEKKQGSKLKELIKRFEKTIKKLPKYKKGGLK